MNHCRRRSFDWVLPLIPCILLFLAITGCSTLTRPPDVYQVELHRSDVQTLRLTNIHDSDLLVVSKDGKNGQTLEPGGSMDIAFVVVTLKDIHLNKANPWYVMQDTSINYVHQPDAPQFLETSGRDLVLNLRPGGNSSDPLRLSLHNCPGDGWAGEPASQGMHMVRSRSVPGVPFRLCPR